MTALDWLIFLSAIIGATVMLWTWRQLEAHEYREREWQRRRELADLDARARTIGVGPILLRRPPLPEDQTTLRGEKSTTPK